MKHLFTLICAVVLVLWVAQKSKRQEFQSHTLGRAYASVTHKE